jgi:hypothetical protein
MAAVDEILSTIPLDQLASRVGAQPGEVEDAVRAALPALLGGLEANAADPAGAASLTEALGQHDSALVEGGVDLDEVDEGDGQKIAHHIFGDNEEQVVSQLGGLGSASSGLIAKLIPLLAPIVLAWLTQQVTGSGRAQQQQGGSGGGLQDILGQVLGGATRDDRSGGPGGMSADSIITDVLGGLLGGGRR